MFIYIIYILSYLTLLILIFLALYAKLFLENNLGEITMRQKYRKIKQYLYELKQMSQYNRRPIKDLFYFNCDYKVKNKLPLDSAFVPYKEGDYWGTGYDTHAWFRFNLEIPADMKGQTVRLSFGNDTFGGWDVDNPQYIIYVDGRMVQGLDINHTYLDFNDDLKHKIHLYAYTGARVSKSRLYVSIANVRNDVEKLWYDIRVPFEVLDITDPLTAEYAEIIKHLDNAVSELDLYEIGSKEFSASIKRAQKYMDEEFYGKYCSPQRETTICIGHTHIDCAWLWTLRQTKEKVQRTFSTVLNLMKKYPNYKFMSSQALLYKDLKEEAPEKYAELKQRLKEGRFECEGAMWVEADCNISSGESLVRQVMYGKRFFKDEFGVDNKVLWLPDVFGYSAALPQILRKSGVNWFVTSKIGWNDTNLMPYDTFEWYGIDGTKINTYFLTAQDYREVPTRECTYNGTMNPTLIKGTRRRYQQKVLSDESLNTFGFGDGGGGPTIEYLEYAKRLEKGIPGIPNAKIDTVTNFLGRLEEKIKDNKNLPKWHGELYLEFHRGTYTTLAKNKKNNRFSEFLYLDTEMLGTIGKEILGKAFNKKELHSGWEMVLTNQFHDIIPGSSIDEVYDQADIDYAYLQDLAIKQSDAIKKGIASKICKDRGYVVFNPHSFTTDGYVSINGKTVKVHNIPSKGYACVKEFDETNAVKFSKIKRQVETDKLLVTFDKNWIITSLFDKENNREVLKENGLGNELRIYADYPDQYDAWEWQEYSTEKYKTIKDVTSCETIDDGVRFGLKIVRPYLKSTITQTIWFYDDRPIIDFDTTLDWHEHKQMLKTAFDVDINTNKATYEIQFGTIERPTHKNTSWDEAKFEVCAHKYADISEGGYGVSILNNCKYGHDIHEGLIQLSLKKGPNSPSYRSDEGVTSFTYSLYVHKGTLSDAETAKESYYLNYGMSALPASAKNSTIPETYSLLSLDKENVICETVKEAEDSLDTIVRLYEYKNTRTNVKVKIGFDAKECFVCDLLENELEKVDISSGVVDIPMNGFEIKTLKFKK